MAITGAQLNTALNYDGDPQQPRVLREFGVYGTLQCWYIAGNQAYSGRTRFVNTTAADIAADQATTVRAALLAGPAL